MWNLCYSGIILTAPQTKGKLSSLQENGWSAGLLIQSLHSKSSERVGYTHRLVPLWMPFSLQNWPSTCNNSLLYSLSIAYLNNLFWKLYLSVPPGKLFHLALKVLSSGNSSCTWRTCSNIWLWSLLRNSTLVFELHLWPVDCCILINKAEKSHTV